MKFQGKSGISYTQIEALGCTCSASVGALEKNRSIDLSVTLQVRAY